MAPFPIDSFGDTFLAGQVIGFIEDHTRTCSKCGRESFYGEEYFDEYDDSDDYICPHCQDDYNWDDEEYEDL